MKNKKGQNGWVVVPLVILAIAAILWVSTEYIDKNKSDNPLSIGNSNGVNYPIESLSGNHVNLETGTTEGSDDLEFYDLGADISDSTVTARETVTFSSGTLNDTSITHLTSGMTQKSMDAYLDGSTNYYDHKIENWGFNYNPNTGKAILVTDDSDSGSVGSYDIGTFADIDAPEALDTGFADNSDGTINYSIGTGDGTVYMDLELGNDEADSKIEDMVLCIGDTASSLEGDELAGITVSRKDGDSIGSVPSDLLSLFNAAAGTGSYACSPIGDVGGLVKGTYRFTIEITEANFGASESFQIGVDDLGAWKARQQPSNGLKATAEEVSIVRVA